MTIFDLLLQLCNTAITIFISNNEHKADDVYTITIFGRYLHSNKVHLSTPVKPTEVLKDCCSVEKHN
jgi:hypothetical protein